MGKRHPNHRRIKKHRTYTVEEVARLLPCHRNTVRGWLKIGLPAIDDRRPFLILGCHLISFLQARRSQTKRQCLPGQMYCLRCRATRFPAGAMADYESITVKIGNLKGICPNCDAFMNRRVSAARLDQVRGNLQIAFQGAPRQLERQTIHTALVIERRAKLSMTALGISSPRPRTNSTTTPRASAPVALYNTIRHSEQDTLHAAMSPPSVVGETPMEPRLLRAVNMTMLAM